MKKKTIITLVIGLVISLSAVSIWRASAATTVGRGYDLFDTPDNAISGEFLSLPAGFFTNSGQKGSNAFQGQVTLKGGADVPGFAADTVIERTNAVEVPGSTELLVIGLRMVAVGTINVTFTDGTSASYSVSVKESSAVPSKGSMFFNANNTFNSSLQINREYTFTSPGQPTKVFDSGTGDSTSGPWPAISLSASGTWQPTTSSLTTNGVAADTDAAAAAPATGGVQIRPNTHQAIIARHAVIIANRRPKPIVKPIDNQPIDGGIGISDDTSTGSGSTNGTGKRKN